MKLKLNKSQLVNLSHDGKVLPEEMTPQIGGGQNNCTCGCCPDQTTPVAGCPGDGGGTRPRMTANEDTCPSDPAGWTNACCMIP